MSSGESILQVFLQRNNNNLLSSPGADIGMQAYDVDIHHLFDLLFEIIASTFE
jgi:hypothetical protein